MRFGCYHHIIKSKKDGVFHEYFADNGSQKILRCGAECHEGAGRRSIGFVFQNYNLVPVLNVYENIVLPIELDGGMADRQFMDEVVRMLALEDKLYSMPNNLSGGQQQELTFCAPG